MQASSDISASDNYSHAKRQAGIMLDNYTAICHAVYAARNDSPHGAPEVPGHSGVSDPTAMSALSNITLLPSVVLANGLLVKEPEAWMRCIREVLRRSDAQTRCIYQHRAESPRRVAARCGISRATYFNLMDRLRTTVAMAAAQCGLVKII